MSIKKRLDKKQKEQTAKILNSLKETSKALAISPTGTGKTTLITNVLSAEIKGKAKALVIVHRHEQLQQVKARLEKNCPGLTISIYAGASKSTQGQIVLASIQTLSRPEALSKVKNDLFTHILVDEVHHAPAETWTRVLTYFRGYKAIGFTATPTRPDGQGLSHLFGEPSTQTLIQEAIDLKIFADPDSTITLLTSSINGVVGKNGNYKPRDLERLATVEGRNNAMVATYLKHGKGKLKELGLKAKTICFCVNTNHALIMKASFIKAGLTSEILVSNVKYLDSVDRDMTFRRFKDTHEIEVLCVVDLFNEAVDLPDTTCVIMARPTRSAIIYTQQIGRAARFLDGKKEKFVILDFVDNTRKGFTAWTSTQLMPGRPKGAAGMLINLEYVQGVEDPIHIQERVDALTVIDDFLRARAEFYSTKEEAYAACRVLGINSAGEYNDKYKEDPRLPSYPQKIYKNWSYTNIQGLNKYFLRMLSVMPKNVKFKEGQIWTGGHTKYQFTDDEYGEFTARPSELMHSPWKKGLTGHKKRGYKRAGDLSAKRGKPFLCLNDNKLWENQSLAAKNYSLDSKNLNAAVRGKIKQIKGLTFRYLTDEELKAYNEKKKGK